MEIGIVGLGLIGASMAQAVKRFTPHRVWGAELARDVLQRALEEQAVDGMLDEQRLGDCDLLLLALYPQAAVDWITARADKLKKDACVVDLCGVKRYVCGALEPLASKYSFFFVGGHPMAGREVSGYGAASAELFLGASMILTPGAETPRARLAQLEAFFASLGFSGVQYASSDEHDRIIAYTSQLAHVLSSAYVKSPSALSYRGFSAGSFRDMTRVAALNETMWTELFLRNRDHLADEIESLCARLAEYGQALRAENAEELCCLLREGRERKKQLSESAPPE